MTFELVVRDRSRERSFPVAGQIEKIILVTDDPGGSFDPPDPPEDPPAGNSWVKTLDGPIFTSGSPRHNWRIPVDPPFSSVSSIHLEFTVKIGRWYPSRPSGFHCFFWLQNGPRWPDMVGYMNSRGRENRVVCQWNGPIGQPHGFPIGLERYRPCRLVEGESYLVSFIYDAQKSHSAYFISPMDNGPTLAFDTVPIPRPGKLPWRSGSFLELGAQIPQGPDSVEALEPGWEYSDLLLELAP